VSVVPVSPRKRRKKKKGEHSRPPPRALCGKKKEKRRRKFSLTQGFPCPGSLPPPFSLSNYFPSRRERRGGPFLPLLGEWRKGGLEGREQDVFSPVEERRAENLFVHSPRKREREEMKPFLFSPFFFREKGYFPSSGGEEGPFPIRPGRAKKRKEFVRLNFLLLA